MTIVYRGPAGMVFGHFHGYSAGMFQPILMLTGMIAGMKVIKSNTRSIPEGINLKNFSRRPPRAPRTPPRQVVPTLARRKGFSFSFFLSFSLFCARSAAHSLRGSVVIDFSFSISQKTLEKT